jgi:hypothetical protein
LPAELPQVAASEGTKHIQHSYSRKNTSLPFAHLNAALVCTVHQQLLIDTTSAQQHTVNAPPVAAPQARL